MLDQIPTERRQVTVFRMAAYLGDKDSLQALDQELVAEFIDLLRSTGNRDSLVNLLDDQFRPKRRLRSKSTRFSDSSFYSSLEMENFLQDIGLDQERIAELIDLLRATGTMGSPEDLLDGPFRPKQGLQSTRFSDGSFTVFYGSLELETAETEVRHHLCTGYSGKPDRRRVAWFQCFRCHFDGYVKDLRTKQEEWPDLTHKNDYEFCNRLGAEARETSLDGLLAPSTRHSGGTNLPVFIRSALSDPRDLRLVLVSCDPA